MLTCLCGDAIGNSGVPGCQTLLGVVHNKWMTPTFDSEGNQNYIDLVALQAAKDSGLVALNQFFLDMTNNPDPSKRWYPTLPLKDVESPREDPNVQTFKDQSTAYISQGVKNMKGFMPKASYTVLRKLSAWGCSDLSEITIDRGGNAAGRMAQGDTKLYPRRITNLWMRGVDATADSNVQMVELNYSWAQTESDADQAILTAGDIEGVDLTSFKGLLDVNLTVSNITTTGFTAKMEFCYGSALKKLPFLGASQADFETPNGLLNNVTTSTVIPITGFVDNEDGTYDFSYAAQAASDVISLKGGKEGFDFSSFEKVEILTP